MGYSWFTKNKEKYVTSFIPSSVSIWHSFQIALYVSPKIDYAEVLTPSTLECNMTVFGPRVLKG